MMSMSHENRGGSANSHLLAKQSIFSLSLFIGEKMSVCFLSVFLSICLSVCLYVFLSVFLSFCLSVFLSFCLSVFLSFCLSVFLSFCLSVFLSFCLSVFLSFCVSVFLSFCLPFSRYESFPSHKFSKILSIKMPQQKVHSYHVKQHPRPSSKIFGKIITTHNPPPPL